MRFSFRRSSVDLSRADLSRADLSRAELSRAELSRVWRWWVRRLLGLGLCLSPLGGCAGLPALLGTQDRPPAAADGLPAAKPLNAETARSLFLIIVDNLHRDGRSRAALAYLDEYDRVYPGDRKAMMLRADCLSDLGQTAAAGPLYRQLLGEGAPAAAYAGLGRIAAASANWPEAAIDFRKASERNAANTSYLNDLGFAQVSAGTYADGLTSLRQALELDPGNAMIRNNLILGLHLAGNDGSARALVDRIAEPGERRRASDLLTLTPAALRQASAAPQATAAGQSATAETALEPANDDAAAPPSATPRAPPRPVTHRAVSAILAAPDVAPPTAVPGLAARAVAAPAAAFPAGSATP